MRVEVLFPFSVDDGPAHQVGQVLEVEVGLATRLARYQYVVALDEPKPSPAVPHVEHPAPAKPARLRALFGGR